MTSPTNEELGDLETAAMSTASTDYKAPTHEEVVRNVLQGWCDPFHGNLHPGKDMALDTLAALVKERAEARAKSKELVADLLTVSLENARLRAALEPFARLSLYGDSDHDCPNNCSDADIIAARAALSTNTPEVMA